MRRCPCGAKIQEGKQVAVWDRVEGELFVSFICVKCSNDSIYTDITKEVMGEVR